MNSPRLPIRRHRHGLWQGASIAWYCALALWATWPLACHPTRTLAAGPQHLETVPLFNVWTIWWNADRALHGFDSYWTAPIFHPAPDTFAFSEPQPMTLLVAPVIWATGSRMLAYNVYLWLSLVLNGLLAERLLRQLRLRPLAAVFGGTLVLLLPIVHWQRDVLQLVPLWGVLWTWSALFGVARRPTLLRGVELGAACSAICLISMHQGLMALTLLAGAGWIVIFHGRRARWWMAGLGALLTFAIIVGPLAWKLHAVASRYEFARPVETVAELSAQLGDYTAATGRQLFETGPLAAREHWRLSPGWVKVLLALGGVAFGLTRRRRRYFTVFLVVTGALAMLLSLGPNLEIAGWQPWNTLARVAPGFAQIRNAFRFAYFVQLALVLLAAQGLSAGLLLQRQLRTRRLFRIALTGAALIMTITEVTPEPLHLAEVPDAAANRGWIEFLRQQTPVGRAIACIPFPTGAHVGDFESTAQWMYLGTFHRVPLVNGYSGFFPPRYFELQQELRDTPFSAKVLQLLDEADVEFIVVNRHWVSAKVMEDLNSRSPRLERVMSDPAGIHVYRLRAKSSHDD